METLKVNGELNEDIKVGNIENIRCINENIKVGNIESKMWIEWGY